MFLKNYPFATALLLGFFASILTSCTDSNGFKKTDSGLSYKFHINNEDGKTPQKGDILYTHMALSLQNDTGDSLLFDSNTFPDYPGGIKFIQLSDPLFKGDIMEGLPMMHIGDSASFIVSADSFFLVSNKMDALPPGVKEGQKLLFNIALVDIQSEEVTMQKLKELRSEMGMKNKQEADKLMAEEQPAIDSYIQRKNISTKPTSTGLYFIETEKGNGPQAKAGQQVTLHYTGYLINGKKFDSSFDRDQPFTFTLGKGEVIGGWDEGVAMMHVGGSATFIIPSELGYGSNGSGAIPPFAPLLFEVQLIKAE
ncbi:MAG: FKBP-type peptidyl-prolyl cis-trans isomerase [Bacteroidia bacterium]